MHVKQNTVMYRGVQIPRPVLPVDLHVAPDFSGRVLIWFEKGEAVCDMPLRDDYMIGSLEALLEMAQRAGWSVTPPPRASGAPLTKRT
nr:hypothetical protein [Trabulsiella odontotermitis]